MRRLITSAHDLDQGSSLLYGSPFDRTPRRGRSIPLELRWPREKLLWAGFNVLLKGHYRDTELIGRIESHLHRLGDPEERDGLIREQLPLEVAVVLSTPDQTQAYLTRPFLLKEGQSIDCAVCKAPITADDTFMKGHRSSHPPRVCLECVKEEAGIKLPIEEGEEIALAWIQHRLIELGKLPGE